MAQRIPLAAVPSQTLTVVLSGQSCEIVLTTLSTGFYFSLTADGRVITVNTICRNVARLLLDRQYLGFVGDFMFRDLQGDTDPVFAGLGTRYVLVYDDNPVPVPDFLP